MPFISSSELCSSIKALYRKTWYLNNPFHCVFALMQYYADHLGRLSQHTDSCGFDIQESKDLGICVHVIFRFYLLNTRYFMI